MKTKCSQPGCDAIVDTNNTRITSWCSEHFFFQERFESTIFKRAKIEENEEEDEVDEEDNTECLDDGNIDDGLNPRMQCDDCNFTWLGYSVTEPCPNCRSTNFSKGKDEEDNE